MKKKLPAGSAAPDFAFKTPWDHTGTLYTSLKEGDHIIFFLRYMGCPLCQLKMRELRTSWHVASSKGLKGFIVLQSEPDVIRKAIEEQDMPFKIICDPLGNVFDLYGISEATIFGYISPVVVFRALKASLNGFKHGRKEGREMQMPAVFVIDRTKTITYAYYGKDISDLPSLETVIKSI